MRGARAVAGVVPPARELRVVRGNGSPAHPRAARHARGPLVRPIGALTDPSPQALVPCCRQLPLQEFCPCTRVILARPPDPDAPFGGGPMPRATGLRASNESPTALRRNASSHYTRPAVTPRFEPRAELRHRCAAAPSRPRPLDQVAPPSRSKLALFTCSVPATSKRVAEATRATARDVFSSIYAK